MEKGNTMTTYTVKRQEIDEVTRIYFVEAESPEEAKALVEQGGVDYSDEQGHMLGVAVKETWVEGEDT